MSQQWVRIQCHGVNEMLDVTAFRQFYLRDMGDGRWIVQGLLNDGLAMDFLTTNPRHKEEAEELLEYFFEAIVPTKVDICKLQENLTTFEHG